MPANSEVTSRPFALCLGSDIQTSAKTLLNDADTSPYAVPVAMLKTVATLLLLWPLICYGFVLLSFPAAGSAAVSRQFQLGTAHVYRLESTVLFNEAGPRVGKDVGYQVTATLNVGVLWQSPFDPNDKLLQLEVSITNTMELGPS